MKIFLIILSYGTLLHGLSFFSMNVATDELVHIDADTGNVTVVGDLGVNIATGGDLAIANGQLYAISTNPFSRVDLFEIDENTGAATSANQVTFSNGAVTHAEGFASDGQNLFLAFSRNSTSSSNTFGQVLTNGSVVGEVNFSSGRDIDALGIDKSGVIYQFDGFVGNTNNGNLHILDVDNVSSSLLKNYSISNFRMNDFVFTDDRLFAIDHKRFELHEIDPSNGNVLVSVDLNPGISLSGLALADDIVTTATNPVPEPSSWALLALALTFLARTRR